MLLAGQSHAVVFRQLVGTVGQLFVGVRVGAVPADAHLDRCVLGGVVDKSHDLILHSDKRVLDHRIRLGEVGHKLIFIVDVRNIIRRLGSFYIKALSGRAVQRTAGKNLFCSATGNPPFLRVTFLFHHLFENFNEIKNPFYCRLILGIGVRQGRALLPLQIVPEAPAVLSAGEHTGRNGSP